MIEKLDFLLGNWQLEYRVPKSSFSKADTGTGSGVFQRALNDRYVTFDYECSLSGGDGAAHGIFARDEKLNNLRYWWFEDSGHFQEAACQILEDGTLFMHWQQTMLKQTFRKEGEQVVLKMYTPLSETEDELILEVIFTKDKV